MSTIHVNRSQKHLEWSNSITLVLKCHLGDTIILHTVYGTNGQITAGYVLEVKLIDLKTANWEWTAIFPGFGLLADHFGDIYGLRLWDLSNGKNVVL